MSMLSAQCKGLREAANCLDEIGISMGHDTTASSFIAHDISERMREAADTIEGLQAMSETCHGESDLSEWVCSECQCWIPLGLTPENIGWASEWRYCPHCGRKVKAVKR